MVTRLAGLALAGLVLYGESAVSVPAWVETESKAAHPKFEATLGGKAAAVTLQLGPSSDQIIIVVLDLTGDSAYVDPARESLTGTISKLPGNCWVGLLRSQDGLHVLSDPGPDRRSVIEQIQNLATSGNPGLLETAQPALALGDTLLHGAPVRVSVLYITDGNIYNYREDFTNPVINQSDPHDLSRRFPEALIGEKISKLIDAAAPLQAPLFVVHIHHRSDRLNRAYENGLQALAESTGGRADFCRSVAEIPEAISSAFGRITSAWRLTLAVPPKIHGLTDVRLAAHSHGKELKLTWRSHLEAKERHKKKQPSSSRPAAGFIQ